MNNLAENLPEINTADTRAFLDRLYKDNGSKGHVTFQTFADAKSGTVKPKIIHLSSGFLDRLRIENESGAGIFVMVNGGDGRGRSIENVTHVRAVFVDLDGVDPQPVINAGLAPHIWVESSPGKYHAYWLVDDCPLDQFTPLQTALAARFDGDKAVKDLPRVMRLPGFFHLKGEPFQTRILEMTDAESYTVAQIVEGLQLEPFLNPPEEKEFNQAKKAADASGHRPGDDFSRRASWSEILSPSGWTLKSVRRDGTELWCKPGKQGQQSATVNYAGSDLLYCYSDTAGLPVQQGLNKFFVYAHLNHSGNFKAATKDLAAKGYGAAKPLTTATVIQMQGAHTTTDPAPPSRLFLSASDFLNSTITATYLISGLIERDTTGQLFGPSGGGKTFTALDMALAVATGGETLDGHRAGQGLVLYLAGEGHNGLRRRVKAWQMSNGKTVEDLRLFHVSSKTISLDGDGIQEIIAEVQELESVHDTAVALTVIDTLARHIEGDENSTRDMGTFIKAVDSLRMACPGSVALLVHHTGHGEEVRTRSRGSSALKGAMDFEMKVDTGEIAFTKMKDGEQPEPIEFKLLPVVVGSDEDGNELTSCVVQYGERAEHHKAKRYTPMEKHAIKALVEASSGPLRVDHGGKYGALVSDWKEAFFTLRRTQEPDVNQEP